MAEMTTAGAVRVLRKWIDMADAADPDNTIIMISKPALALILSLLDGGVVVPWDLAVRYRKLWYSLDQRRVRIEKETTERELAILFMDAIEVAVLEGKRAKGDQIANER